MRVCVIAGGRHLGDLHRAWWDALTEAEKDLGGFDAVWTGACGMDSEDTDESKLKGGDALAVKWARFKRKHVELFPAPWYLQRSVTPGRPGPAGPRRIGDMFDGRRGYQLVPNGRRHQLTTRERVDGEIVGCILLPGESGTDRTGSVAESRSIPVRRVPMQWLAGEPRPVHASTVKSDEPGVVYVGPAVEPEGWEASALYPPFPMARAEDLGRYRVWLAGALGITHDGKRMVPETVAAIDRIGMDSRVACWDVRKDGYGLTYASIIIAAWHHLTSAGREQGAA